MLKNKIKLFLFKVIVWVCIGKNLKIYFYKEYDLLIIEFVFNFEMQNLIVLDIFY